MAEEHSEVSAMWDNIAQQMWADYQDLLSRRHDLDISDNDSDISYDSDNSGLFSQM